MHFVAMSVAIKPSRYPTYVVQERSLESIGIHHPCESQKIQLVFLGLTGSETSDTYWKHRFAVFFEGEEYKSVIAWKG